MDQFIAHITDLHLDEKITTDNEVNARANLSRILEDVKARGIKKIILGGDLGEEHTYPWLFNSLAAYDVSITLGNHDRKVDVLPYFNPKQNSDSDLMYYAIEDESYKYLFWDSSAGLITREQMDWLEQEVVTDKQILFFIHHPILPVEIEVDRRHSLMARDSIARVLERVGRKIHVFCGHYHCEDTTSVGIVIQYVTPAVSFQVKKLQYEIQLSNDTFGYRLIHLDKGHVKTELVYIS